MKRATLLLLLLMLMLLFSLQGCSKKQDTTSEISSPVSLVIIAGRHANANMYTDDMLESIRPLIERAVNEYEDSDGYHAEADVSVIVCDGNPQRVTLESDGQSILSIKPAPNLKKFEEEKGHIADNIIRFLLSDTLIADDPEVDLLKALIQAQDILNSRKGTERHIVILDTGITTSGYLDMRRNYVESYGANFFDNDMSDVLSHIQEGIPNLDQTQVTFIGLGNVGAEQSQLQSKTAREKLIALWTGIIVDAGHGSLTDELYISENYGVEMAYSEDAADGTGYPPVGTVSLPAPDGSPISATNIVYTPSTPENPESEPEPYVAAALHVSDLGFQKNTAEFRDENQVRATLNALAPELEKLLNNTEYNIYIVGSIAKVTPTRTDKHNETSRDRAQAIADKLVSDHGLPRDRLVVIDAGVTVFSWRNADESDGPKQSNRIVAIISGNCDSLIDELSSAGYIDCPMGDPNCGNHQGAH